MVTLNLVQDEEVINKLFLKSGMTRNKDSHCLWAKSGDELIGYSIFDLDEKRMTVRFIDPITDIALADGILRSTLHIAAQRFVLDAFYAETLSEEFLEKIGFIKEKEEKRLDIDKLFKSCANCGG